MSTLEQEYVDLLQQFGIECDDPQSAMMSDQDLSRILSIASGLPGYNVLAGYSLEEVKKSLAPITGSGSLYAHALSEIVDSAREHQVQATVNVWAGRFPTGCLNAQAVRMKSGILLLVNTGLEDWLDRIASVYVSSIDFGIRAKDGSVQNVPRKNDDEVVHELAALVFDYLIKHGVSYRPPFALDAGVRGLLMGALSDGARTFALAHEYGHAVAGHLNSADVVQRAVAQPGGKLSFLQKSWKQEYEADALGMDFLLPPSRLQIASRDDLLFLSTRAMGPFLLLGLASLVESIVSQVQAGEDRTVVVSDHPPTRSRISVLKKAWAEIVPDDVVTQLSKADIAMLPEGLIEWFDRIRPKTAELVVRKLQVEGP